MNNGDYMSYIDTSDNVKPEQYTVQAIFAKLDFIEFKITQCKFGFM